MAAYTIKDMRERFNIPSSTLRYYEDIGLFPEVKRTKTNQRIYTDAHIERLCAINCFKRTGLPMTKIRDFFEYAEDLCTHIDDIILMMENHEKNILPRSLNVARILRRINASMQGGRPRCSECYSD